jgi:hypothetical protein
LASPLDLVERDRANTMATTAPMQQNTPTNDETSAAIANPFIPV